MKKITIYFLFFPILFLGCEDSSQLETSNLNPISQNKNIQDSTALIISGKVDDLKVGTGFFIKDNVLVTTYHVVRNAKTNEEGKTVVFFRVGDQKEDSVLDVGEVVVGDEDQDLALIKPLNNTYPFLELGSLEEDSEYEDELKKDVFVYSYPEEFYGIWSKGLLLDFRPLPSSRYKTSFLHMEAKAEKGSSGAPVLNSQSQVIGILSFIHEDEPFSLAVPVTRLKSLIKEKKAELAIL